MTRRLLTSILLALTSIALATGGATIRENGGTYRIDCPTTSDVITVRGNNNTVILTGTCENVVIYGNGNVVTAVAVHKIWTKGNGNRITVGQAAPSPVIYNSGKENGFFRAR